MFGPWAQLLIYIICQCQVKTNQIYSEHTNYRKQMKTKFFLIINIVKIKEQLTQTQQNRQWQSMCRCEGKTEHVVSNEKVGTVIDTNQFPLHRKQGFQCGLMKRALHPQQAEVTTYKRQTLQTTKAAFTQREERIFKSLWHRFSFWRVYKPIKE